ncbi:hypothetical protein TNIN_305561 [Trichonephila inaurata madagascariensis]|uniref:Sulfotransferase domain-containing protein n=1 Tax=Trichonephila inaurata madagascariensis TaxID=2747483 RepID=A0A8X7BY12_9ARAC|nr:hypothetical protein TNIN_305561 [Trichonephila inaurata madagascariensis]
MPRISKTQKIRGFPFPKVSWYTKEHIEETLDYESCDGDIIICSYPKTGTTWLQYIILQILSKGKEFPSYNEALFKTIPFMEMAGRGPVDAMEGLRIYRHHCPFHLIKKNAKAKYLYIYRNPEDTFVSYYYFLQNVKEEKFDFDQFFEEFLTSEIEYGSYFEHILSFLMHKNDGNLLLISYEKLFANRKEGYLRIAKFLGEEYYQNIVNDKELLNRILQNTHFDYMKNKLYFVHPTPKEIPKGSIKIVEFFRKGVVGDGKNKLSPHQIKRIRELANEIMKGTEVLKEWYG